MGRPVRHKRSKKRRRLTYPKHYRAPGQPKKKEDNRGPENEARFQRALTHGLSKLPKWFLGVRKATKEEDARGIDAIVQTDGAGKIYVQIKSSEMGKARFLREQRQGRDNRHPDIVVIVVRDADSFEEIVANFVKIVGDKREELLKRRGPKGA